MYINRHFVYIRSSIIINYYCYFLWNNYTIAFIEVHFIITVFIFNIINYCFLFKIFSYYDSTIKTAMGTGSDKNFINVYLRKSAVSRHFTFYYLIYFNIFQVTPIIQSSFSIQLEYSVAGSNFRRSSTAMNYHHKGFSFTITSWRILQGDLLLLVWQVSRTIA